MRVALCSSIVPFINGGARNIVEWLEVVLREAGHEVERVYLPQVDAPEILLTQMAAYRFVDLDAADRVICFRPPSHLISHPRKVVWFIHHIRKFYDLWDSPYRSFPDDSQHRAIRDALHAADTAALSEAHRVFTNSVVVADRLARFNGIHGEVLYPPILRPERFALRGFNDEIVCICRMEHHKRQHLLVEALAKTRTRVRLRLCGVTSNQLYRDELNYLIRSGGVADRVVFDDRWIDETEKADILADCLAAAYVPLDEDSYGYPSLEAALSSKAVLTTTDSGGVLEFVEDDVNGVVAEPDPEALAAAMDKLYVERERTVQLGQNARERIDELQINWDHVLERVLS